MMDIREWLIGPLCLVLAILVSLVPLVYKMLKAWLVIEAALAAREGRRAARGVADRLLDPPPYRPPPQRASSHRRRTHVDLRQLW